MAYSNANNSEWLGSIRKILEADTLLKNKNDEDLADELASTIGFPFNSEEDLDIYAFWEIMIERLKVDGYRIVDDIYYAESYDEELEHRKKLIEEINRYINK